jgi:hypothetical protein
MMALLIVGLVYSQGTARADQGGTTGAVVTNTGDPTPPAIMCKWELMDMQPGNGLGVPPVLGGLADSTVPDTKIQYGKAAGPHAHDDDMAVDPTTVYACDSAPNSFPTQAQNIMKMIQFRPLAHKNPDGAVPNRYVQLWMAVGHPNGTGSIGDAFWEIYHPDGSKKIQVHGTRIGAADGDKLSPGDFLWQKGDYGDVWGDSRAGYDHNNDVAFGTVGINSALERRKIECSGLGNSTATGTMFEAAYDIGEVSKMAIEETAGGYGLTDACIQGTKSIFYAKFAIHKDQPCGKYKVVATATSKTTGAPSEQLVNYFDVLCFQYLNVDFDGLDWGEITPGTTQQINGNLVWNTPIAPATMSSNPPTVHNGGNSPMGINLSFEVMLRVCATGEDPCPEKEINMFDACFAKGVTNASPNLACIGEFNGDGTPNDLPITPDELVAFGPNVAGGAQISGVSRFAGDFDQVLCHNERGKLDLSIHPMDGLLAGAYVGEFHINYHHVHDATLVYCTGDQVVH